MHLLLAMRGLRVVDLQDGTPFKAIWSGKMCRDVRLSAMCKQLWSLCTCRSQINLSAMRSRG